jgi:malonyl-CoA/methylmalonyl-CoA synthetase
MNLFSALQAQFGAATDVAVEVADEPAGGDASHPGPKLQYTFGDIERASAMIANLLGSLELPSDARVAVHTDKSVEGLLLYLAVLRAGYTYLPLNNAYRAAELDYFIGNAKPSVVVCASKDFDDISRIAFKYGTSHVFTLDTDRTGSLLQRAAQHSDHHVAVAREADDLAAILYTSGTTGRSKGAMLTHGNLLSNAQTLKAFWGWRPASQGGDVLIHALPIFHVHGLFVGIHGALLNGSRMIWFNRFDPKAVVARLPEASVFMGVPTLYVRMLAEPGLTSRACSSMRVFIAGSAPLLPETFDAWRERTGHTIVERYGMSETVMLTSNPYHATDGQRRAGTVGQPLPGVQLRIHNDDGTAAGVDEIAGIQVRGPNVFKGYWLMPEKTKEEFTADGWFKTGDVGKVDAHGVVTIVGRSKDLVISGGFNVYPAEIEGYLNEMPGVAESAVIGVPHPDFGEAVVAVIVAKPAAQLNTDQMIASLKQRIANFKVPKRAFVVDALPRNSMGKVQKNLLREQHQTLFTT